MDPESEDIAGSWWFSRSLRVSQKVLDISQRKRAAFKAFGQGSGRKNMNILKQIHSFIHQCGKKEEKEQKRSTDILEAEIDILLSVHKSLYFILEKNWFTIILVSILRVGTIKNNLTQIIKK